jgi:hypothetical protein
MVLLFIYPNFNKAEYIEFDVLKWFIWNSELKIICRLDQSFIRDELPTQVKNEGVIS